MRIQRGDEVFEILVRALSDTRGPAPMAQMLFEESAESRQQRAELRELRFAQRTGYQAPEHKPDKRARRLIRALGDIDAL